jgi:electron transport complex protein RnfD
MSEPEPKTDAPLIHVAPSPHVFNSSLTTRRMMIDVLIALTPVMLVSIYVFRAYALVQVGLCVLACLTAELAFKGACRVGLIILAVITAVWLGGLWLIENSRASFGEWADVARLMGVFGGLGALFAFSLLSARRARGSVTVADFSAAVTGVILAMSLPGTAPWYVGVIGSVVAIGIGKVLFGGLGQNIFNPAMVGRAFVMLCFAGAVGACGYVVGAESAWADAVTKATPMALAKTGKEIVALKALLLGNTNGSLGETSALACLAGGLYLCLRRTASWEIPAGMLAAVAVIGGLVQLGGGGEFTAAHHLLGGAVLFGAFFIATDLVTSPLTPKGKLIFGAGVGAMVMLIRLLSNYPEGVMFAVLVMNALVPLINQWTVPRPVGGPVAAKNE